MEHAHQERGVTVTLKVREGRVSIKTSEVSLEGGKDWESVGRKGTGFGASDSGRSVRGCRQGKVERLGLEGRVRTTWGEPPRVGGGPRGALPGRAVPPSA